MYMMSLFLTLFHIYNRNITHKYRLNYLYLEAFMKFTLLFLIGLFLYILWYLFKFSISEIEEFEDNRILEDRHYEYDEEELVDDDDYF